MSLLLHAVAVSTAVLTLSDLALVSEKEPFRWKVSFVQASAVQGGDQAAASAVSSQEPPPAVEQVRQEVRPVAEPVEPVQSRTLIETKPVVQPIVEPVQQQMNMQKPTKPIRQADEIPAPKPVETPEPMIARAVSVEQPAVSQALAAMPAQSADLVAMVKPSPAGIEGPRADYGWLAQSLWQRVVELKRYPNRARLNHWEGKVVLRAVIRHDGHLEGLTLQNSSGYEELDEAAMELVREACPLHMAKPLGRAQVVVQVPITYALK